MGVDQETLAIDLQSMTKDDDEILTIEEARKIIQILKDRCRFQTHQALIWRKKAKIQEQHIARISSEYNTRLESLTSDLLLFEARLSKKQREITELLDERDCIIDQQQQIIQCLHSRLADFGVTMTVTSLDDGNVDDSDSAVIMEEDEFSSQVDATEHLQSNQQNQQQPRPITTEDGRETDSRGNVTATYNRVMSNHRSVTKPKDVKYKRINKAKSKSLEELRGRLKNWVDRGTRMSLSVEPAYR
ncbi:uncharacterized protein LOC126894560 [Daktulosphaira vitifoliae]|uniref:uncharacterized protein LOC126894560 n=1 Tax=Daktulosphaira vitifoliae TaxID=58002 RepID=UPI0021AA0441|nr:uncharacterized protein LOC126894560 [Daktulosphaira vitifoliae]XP_050521627.1 uncharacterized protein LOC126894560 [Daktulosphaira vitifoliae]